MKWLFAILFCGVFCASAADQGTLIVHYRNSYSVCTIYDESNVDYASVPVGEGSVDFIVEAGTDYTFEVRSGSQVVATLPIVVDTDEVAHVYLVVGGDGVGQFYSGGFPDDPEEPTENVLGMFGAGFGLGLSWYGFGLVLRVVRSIKHALPPESSE